MLSKETLELVGKATALAAFLFTAGSYVFDLWSSRQADRYQASVALMERYRTDGIREAESKLQRQMLWYHTEGRDPNNPQDYPQPIFVGIANEVFFGDTGQESSARKPLLPDIFRITDFYGEVQFCEVNEICNAEIIDAYFCPRALTFAGQNDRLLTYYGTYSGNEEWMNGL